LPGDAATSGASENTILPEAASEASNAESAITTVNVASEPAEKPAETTVVDVANDPSASEPTQKSAETTKPAKATAASDNDRTAEPATASEASDNDRATEPATEPNANASEASDNDRATEPATEPNANASEASDNDRATEPATEPNANASETIIASSDASSDATTATATSVTEISASQTGSDSEPLLPLETSIFKDVEQKRTAVNAADEDSRVQLKRELDDLQAKAAEKTAAILKDIKHESENGVFEISQVTKASEVLDEALRVLVKDRDTALVEMAKLSNAEAKQIRLEELERKFAEGRDAEYTRFNRKLTQITDELRAIATRQANTLTQCAALTTKHAGLLSQLATTHDNLLAALKDRHAQALLADKTPDPVPQRQEFRGYVQHLFSYMLLQASHHP